MWQLENISFKKICLLYYLNNEIFICVVCYVVQSRSCQSAQLTSTAIAMTMGHSGMLGHLLPLLHYTRHRLHCFTDWAVSVCQNDQNYLVRSSLKRIEILEFNCWKTFFTLTNSFSTQAYCQVLVNILTFPVNYFWKNAENHYWSLVSFQVLLK